MTPQFEEYLKQVHAEHFSDGVADDDLYEDYERWLQDLNADELIAYEDEFSKQK